MTLLLHVLSSKEGGKKAGKESGVSVHFLHVGELCSVLAADKEVFKPTGF